MNDSIEQRWDLSGCSLGSIAPLRFFRLCVCSYMFNRQHNWNSELQIGASRLHVNHAAIWGAGVFSFPHVGVLFGSGECNKKGLKKKWWLLQKKIKKHRNGCQEDWIISGALVCFQLCWMATSHSRSGGSLGRNLLSHLKNCFSFLKTLFTDGYTHPA